MRSAASSGPTSPITLPLPQYVASRGVLACLLLGSAFLLPRTASFDISPTSPTSLDRPSHPLLVALTADPAKTMLCESFGATICMLWWSPSLRSWWSPSKAPDKEARVRETLRRIATAIVVTTCATVLLSPVLMILGAPLDRHHLRTALLAYHLSVLSVWPIVYALGPEFLLNIRSSSRYTIVRMFCEGRLEYGLEKALVYPIFGLLIGALVGSMAYPLDWDRPWQAYPLPAMGGSLVGYITGGFCVLLPRVA